jgi:hypothetical protein
MKAVTPYLGRIRSHDPLQQSSRWQAEAIALDHAARAKPLYILATELQPPNNSAVVLEKSINFTRQSIIYSCVLLR